MPVPTCHRCSRVLCICGPGARLRAAVYCVAAGAAGTLLAATAALTVDGTGAKRAVWAGVLLAVAVTAGVRLAARR